MKGIKFDQNKQEQNRKLDKREFNVKKLNNVLTTKNICG